MAKPSIMPGVNPVLGKRLGPCGFLAPLQGALENDAQNPGRCPGLISTGAFSAEEQSASAQTARNQCSTSYLTAEIRSSNVKTRAHAADGARSLRFGRDDRRA